MQNSIVHPWLDFFDWLGCSDKLTHHYWSSQADDAWCDTFQKAFISRRAQAGLSPSLDRSSNRSGLGLLRLLGRLASAGHSIEMIPAEMLNVDSFQDPRYKLAALLVRLTQPTLKDEVAIRLAEDSVPLWDPPAERGAVHLILRTAERNLGRVPAIAQFLLRLRNRMPSNVHLGVAACERLLRQVIRRRASDLHHEGQLPVLKLPMVPPMRWA